MSYKELEKMLYSTLKYNAEINEYCERLQIRYDELPSIDLMICWRWPILFAYPDSLSLFSHILEKWLPITNHECNELLGRNRQVIFLIYSSYLLYFLCFFQLFSHVTWGSVKSEWEIELALLTWIWTSISFLQFFLPSHLLLKLNQ